MSDASRSWGRIGALALAAALIGSSGAAPADQVRLGAGTRPRIVNGVTSHAYPTTAALLYSGGSEVSLDNAELRCSATLIGCRTVLTAAHCVDEDPLASHYLVYFQHAGIHAVESIAVHPSSAFPIADVAVLRLADQVTGIDPTALNLVDPAPFVPIAGTIVGFGQTQGGANDYGIKRVGAVATASCPAGLPNGAGDDELVCWNFEAPVGAPGADSNTCNGDSGGPLFLDLGGGETIAGVTSGGTSFFCLTTDHSYDASVYTYRNFILAQLGGDATGTCGGLPPVGDGAVDVVGFDGALDSGNLSDSVSVPVPAGKNTVRFGLNGEDNGGFGVDMYVKAGAGASPSDFDCKADGGSVFGACTFDLPAAATYSVFLQRTSGSGDYQLTATTFGGAAPVCGDNTRGFNEDCDGSDDAQCDGLCQPDCSCPPPVCGNDVREQSEQCDGSDDGACPGACAACECPPPCQVGGMAPVRLRATPERLRFRATVQNFFGEFDGQDPRAAFALVLTQGAESVTVSIPPNDPGWADSDVGRRKFKWRGNVGGITRIKVIDRPGQGVLKLILVGKGVPGSGAIDDDLPVTATLTLDERCVDQSF